MTYLRSLDQSIRIPMLLAELEQRARRVFTARKIEQRFDAAGARFGGELVIGEARQELVERLQRGVGTLRMLRFQARQQIQAEGVGLGELAIDRASAVEISVLQAPRGQRQERLLLLDRRGRGRRRRLGSDRRRRLW